MSVILTLFLGFIVFAVGKKETFCQLCKAHDKHSPAVAGHKAVCPFEKPTDEHDKNLCEKCKAPLATRMYKSKTVGDSRNRKRRQNGNTIGELKVKNIIYFENMCTLQSGLVDKAEFISKSITLQLKILDHIFFLLSKYSIYKKYKF